MASLSLLTDPSLMIIFASSPLGLGHLRVTDALHHGLPKEAPHVLVGAKDPSMSAAYRFMSIHPLARQLMLLTQKPPLEVPFAQLDTLSLHLSSGKLYNQIKTVLGERITVPNTVLLIATIMTVGHKLGAIKKKLEKEMGVKIFLIVQVTDDSPQVLWYVPEADLIFVPSFYTKEKLMSYAEKYNLPRVPIVISAYPISPLLTEKLTESEHAKRVEQTDPDSRSIIHMSIPIPGAAVGTGNILEFIQTTHNLSERFKFHVVSRQAPFTKLFLSNIQNLPFVVLSTSDHDRSTVDNYEKLFKEQLVSLEMTKPSEQAFKSLVSPKQRGGAIMLFSDPIGVQEIDNLHFLQHHGLIPTDNETKILINQAQRYEKIDNQLLDKARHWRGLRLPKHPQEAARFAVWTLNEKLLHTMSQYVKGQDSIETEDNGVEQFWDRVCDLISNYKASLTSS